MLFAFGWMDWEDHAEFMLEHKDKTSTDFLLDCKKALRLAAASLLEYFIKEEQILLEYVYQKGYEILISDFGYSIPTIFYGPRANMCVRPVRHDKDTRWALGTECLKQLELHNKRAEELYNERFE